MPLHSKPSSTTFQQSYLREFPWVREHPIKTMVICSWCKKDINIGGMGKTALRSHAKSAKHMLNEKSIKQSIPLNVYVQKFHGLDQPGPSSRPDEVAGVAEPTPVSASPNPDQNQSSVADSQTSKTSTSTSTTRPQSIMKQFILSESVTKSEIFWCLQAVINHIPFSVAARCANSFKTQFPDSEVASKLKLDYTKVGYLIVFGLAPYFERQFVKKIEDSTHLVLCFDEALNKVSQRQQMDLHIRWWNPDTNRVETRYHTSVFLGHAKSEDLLQGIKKSIPPETLNKVVQISMDGPNVNLKLFNDLQTELLESTDGHILLNIGSCGLHTLHGAFKNGIKSTKWDIVGFLRALYNLFKDSPARRADFKHYSSTETFPLKFCAVRWVESGRVAERALTILPSVRKYVNGVVQDKKEPTCNSFVLVKEKLNDKLLSAKLSFFVTMCGLFEPFLREYQTDAPMAPFLYNEINSLLLTLLEKIVKKDHLDGVKNQLNKVDLSVADNLIPTKHFDLGFATKDALKKCDSSSDLEKLNLKKDAREAVMVMAKKILEKSPIKYPFSKFITCLDPSIIHSEGERHLTKCLEQLVAKKWMSGLKADTVKRQYIKLFSSEHTLRECKIYKRNEKRLDDFFTNLIDVGCDSDGYKELRQFVQLILTMSHGNATVERGFSVNKQCVVENLKEESLVAIRKVHDSVTAAGGVEAVQLTTELVHSAKNAHARYIEHLAENREKMKALTKEADERKRAEKEKKALEAERLQLLSEARKRAAELDFKIEELSKKCKK